MLDGEETVLTPPLGPSPAPTGHPASDAAAADETLHLF
jgi:hypothetical protein